MSDAILEIELSLLLEGVFQRYHQDFRHYARASLRRRIREAMNNLECATISRLQERVLREPAAFSRLFSYLTIPVSEMFRNPPFYQALRTHVVPLLKTYPSLKIWVAGCSTGEEVYSLAILLREEGLEGRSLIYATDVNQCSLQTAEAGVYPLDRFSGFSAAYLASGGHHSLSDYCTIGDTSVALDRTLREAVVFSDHSLATDNVFAEVQLVTCRNVLIYFDRDLQDRAFGLFRDSLCEKGFLGLGWKETTEFSRHSKSFTPFSYDERIYRRT